MTLSLFGTHMHTDENLRVFCIECEESFDNFDLGFHHARATHHTVEVHGEIRTVRVEDGAVEAL